MSPGSEWLNNMITEFCREAEGATRTSRVHRNIYFCDAFLQLLHIVPPFICMRESIDRVPEGNVLVFTGHLVDICFRKKAH